MYVSLSPLPLRLYNTVPMNVYITLCSILSLSYRLLIPTTNRF